MATRAAALLTILGEAAQAPDSPITGAGNTGKIENRAGGQRWADGTGAGQIDRPYRANHDLLAAATDNYDLLAAGSLTDIQGQAIDADELKGMVIKCTAGDIAVKRPVANGITCLTAASEGVALAAGHTMALDFGDVGLDVTTDSKFDVAEAGAPGAAASYELWFVVAQ